MTTQSSPSATARLLPDDDAVVVGPSAIDDRAPSDGRSEQTDVARFAFRRTGTDFGPGPSDSRRPFVALVEIAQVLTFTTHVTTRVRWGGSKSAGFTFDLIVAAIEPGDRREVDG